MKLVGSGVGASGNMCVLRRRLEGGAHMMFTMTTAGADLGAPCNPAVTAGI
jgi:hypothetical protein